MTHDELMDSVSRTVRDALEQNLNLVKENLLFDTKDTDSREQIIVKMINNSIGIATQLSVQTVIFLLENYNVIDPSNYKMRDEQPQLKLVWDSSKHPLEDN